MKIFFCVLLLLIVLVLLVPFRAKFLLVVQQNKIQVLHLCIYPLLVPVVLLDQQKKKLGETDNGTKKQTKKKGLRNTIKEIQCQLPPAGAIWDMLTALFEGIGALSRRLHFSRVEVCARVGGDDPSDAALNFGRIGAVVYPALGILSGIFTVRTKSVSITPDFETPGTTYRIGGTFWALPVVILIILCIVVWRFFALQKGKKNSTERSTI